MTSGIRPSVARTILGGQNTLRTWQTRRTIFSESFPPASVPLCLCRRRKRGRSDSWVSAFSSSPFASSGQDHGYAKLKRDASSLVDQASFKIRGSKHHSKLLRRHVAIFCEAVRAGLLHNKGELYGSDRYSNNSCEATRKLTASLGGIGADRGIMPDFSNPRALRGYTLGHFGRVRLLSQLVAQTEPDWLATRVSQIFSDELSNRADDPHCSSSLKGGSEIALASLGGGCGYDFVAMSALSEFLKGPKIAATVFEYEPAWKDVLGDVESVVQDVVASKDNRAVSHAHRCGFESCDITRPLDSSSNEALASVVGSTHMFSCSYVVAENAVGLRTNKYEFFRQLFSEASDGSLFFFTETTHRLWPDLIDVAMDHNDHLSTIKISIPHIRCGKSGWQLALLKDSAGNDHGGSKTCSLEEHQRVIYERFRSDNLAHLSRLDRGWKRDKKKARGAKQLSHKDQRNQ